MGSHKWASCYTFHVRFASSSVFVFSKNRWAGMSLQRSPNPCPCPEDPHVQYNLLEPSELWNVWSVDQPCYIFTSFTSLMFSDFSETLSSHTSELVSGWALTLLCTSPTWRPCMEQNQHWRICRRFKPSCLLHWGLCKAKHLNHKNIKFFPHSTKLTSQIHAHKMCFPSAKALWAAARSCACAPVFWGLYCRLQRNHC